MWYWRLSTAGMINILKCNNISQHHCVFERIIGALINSIPFCNIIFRHSLQTTDNFTKMDDLAGSSGKAHYFPTKIPKTVFQVSMPKWSRLLTAEDVKRKKRRHLTDKSVKAPLCWNLEWNLRFYQPAHNPFMVSQKPRVAITWGGLKEGESAWVGKPNWKRQPKMTNEAVQPLHLLLISRKCWWQWSALNINAWQQRKKSITFQSVHFLETENISQKAIV